MHKLVIMDKLFIQGNQQYFLHGQKNIYYSLSSSLAWVLCQTFIDFSSWK